MLKTNQQLTPEVLAGFPNLEIFASGEAPDSPNGLNMTNSGKWLAWVACKGGIEDWAVYVAWAVEDQDLNAIKTNGDKVHGFDNIRNIMDVSDAAFALYRR